MANDSSLQLLNVIAQTIYNKNGFNIFALDMTQTSHTADYLLIAEGNVDRHVKALAKSIIEETEKIHRLPYLVDGLEQGNWVVIDFVDVNVHLFIPELRERYALEELWGAGKIVDLDIVVPTNKESL